MVNVSEEKEITAQISIVASYDDLIKIDVYDKASSSIFLTLEMTREQFINAAMNRLGNTDVKHATVRNIEILGKTMEMKPFEFELPEGSSFKEEKLAMKIVKDKCPEGWRPDLYFTSQNSFFEGKNGKRWARTIIRRWV